MLNIYGAGGHGKVVIECCKAENISIDQVYDDNRDIKYLKGLRVRHRYQMDLTPEVPFIVAVGNNRIREKIVQKITHPFGLLVHPHASVSDTVVLGEGTVVFSRAVLQAEVRIGKHCIVNSGSVVEHESVLEDFVHIGPGAVVCGNVEIGYGTFIGAGSTVIQGVKIGRNVIAGAGAVIIRDVPDGAVVVGNPGKIIRYAHEK